MEEDITLPLNVKDSLSTIQTSEGRSISETVTTTSTTTGAMKNCEIPVTPGKKESLDVDSGKDTGFVKETENNLKGQGDKGSREEENTQHFNLEIDIENDSKELNKDRNEDTKTLTTEPNTPNTKENLNSFASSESPDVTLRSVTTKLEQEENVEREGINLRVSLSEEFRKESLREGSLQESGVQFPKEDVNNVSQKEGDITTLANRNVSSECSKMIEGKDHNFNDSDNLSLTINSLERSEKSMDDVKVILPKRTTMGKDLKNTKINLSPIIDSTKNRTFSSSSSPSSSTSVVGSRSSNISSGKRDDTGNESLLNIMPNPNSTSPNKISSFSTTSRDNLLVNNGREKSKSNDTSYIPSASLRRGKWTYEEEAYVMKMIDFFQAGLLPIAPGTTLRSYLSEKLHCDPMRITKKFTGPHCIGKRVFHPYDPSQRSVEEVDEKLKELDLLERKWYTKIFAQDRELEFRNYLLHTKPHLSLDKVCVSTSHNAPTNKSSHSEHYKNNNPLNNRIGSSRQGNSPFANNNAGGSVTGNMTGNFTPVWGYPHPHSQGYVNYHPNNYNPQLSNIPPPHPSSTTNQHQSNGNYMPNYYYMNHRHQGNPLHMPRTYPVSSSNPNQPLDNQRVRSTSVSSIVSNVSNCSAKLHNPGQLPHVHSNNSLNGLNASFTTASSNHQNKVTPQMPLPSSPNIQGMKPKALSQQKLRSLSYQEMPYPPTRNNSFISLQGNIDQQYSNQRGRNDSVGSLGSCKQSFVPPPRHPIMIPSPLMSPYPPNQQMSTMGQTSPFLKSGNVPRVNSSGSMSMQGRNPSNRSHLPVTSASAQQQPKPTYSNTNPQYSGFTQNQLERQGSGLSGSKPPGLPSTPYPPKGATCPQVPPVLQQNNLSGESKDNCMSSGIGQMTTKRKSSDSFVENTDNMKGHRDSPKKVKMSSDSNFSREEISEQNYRKDSGEQKV